MLGQHCWHVGNKQKCLSFGGCSQQTQIPTLPAKPTGSWSASLCRNWDSSYGGLTTATPDDHHGHPVFHCRGWFWIKQWLWPPLAHLGISGAGLWPDSSDSASGLASRFECAWVSSILPTLFLAPIKKQLLLWRSLANLHLPTWHINLRLRRYCDPPSNPSWHVSRPGQWRLPSPTPLTRRNRHSDKQ